MNKLIALASAAIISLQTFAAEAHPDVHGEEGFAAGIAHQFTQADHLSIFLVAAFGLILSGVVLFMQRRGVKAKK